MQESISEQFGITVKPSIANLYACPASTKTTVVLIVSLQIADTTQLHKRGDAELSFGTWLGDHADELSDHRQSVKRTRTYMKPPRGLLLDQGDEHRRGLALGY
jgi:hypothetical protein